VKKTKIPECLKKLTYKQRAFVLRYLVHFNGTKAAIEAGYSIKTARNQASQNLTKLNISDAINELLEESGFSKNKILKRLGQFAFGCDLADFEDLARGKTLSEVRKAGAKTSLIKKIKTKRLITGDKENPEEYEVTDIELHDGLSAMREIIKVRGIGIETVNGKNEITVTHKSEWR